MIRVFTNTDCLAHRAPVGYPEVPARLSTIVDHLDREGFEVVEAASLDRAEARAGEVHDPAYVDRFRRAVERGDGLLDSADNPLSAGTWTAALAAAGCALEAADWLMEGHRRVAFAAVRPPGHHAEHALAMGFCYLNNAAIAAAHLRAEHGCERVAIFDHDVHHGNGTQHIFEEEADVLYASTHQYPFYPGTGSEAETGRGAGEGSTVNVPLAAGTGDAGYLAAIEERILPALERFAPDVLLLSAGFDAWKGDPLGGMSVSEGGYETWGQRLGELAGRVSNGRVLALLEGGYDLSALPTLAATHLDGLADGVGSRR